MTVTVRLPDDSTKSYDAPVACARVAEDISPRLARAALAADIDGELVDLATRVAPGEHTVSIVTDRDPRALEILRHTAAHVMAQAVVRLLGDGVQYTIGPALTDDFQYGFYYDFDLPRPITQDDLPKIEAEMAKIVGEDLALERLELGADEARSRLAELGQRYKVEMIDDLVAEESVETISLYRQGDFVDMCRGPHLPSTGKLGAFKLLSTAGAYWRGDESNQMLTRIYGTAFFDKKALAEQVRRVEEARKRDHRILGRQLGLFLISDSVGSGLPLWTPKGTLIRMELEGWLRGELLRRGYQAVITPHIGKIDLYRTSGHYPYYEHGLFPAMVPMKDQAAKACLDALVDLADREGQDSTAEPNDEAALVRAARLDKDKYPWGQPLWHRIAVVKHLGRAVDADGKDDGLLLKPMNCPHHIQIYKSQQRSYRGLPVRLSEFGTVYRYEQSGELSGLTRVRGFTQDDAHIFCTPDQLEAEIESCVELTKLVLQTLGLADYRVRIGLRDADSAKYIGESVDWDRAEANIRNVVKKVGLDYAEEPGEAAFYGPKIDFVVTDCIGREWQLGTIQVDYNLPERFDLEYVGADNAVHRPVMIHRAPLGSPERFIGILIEHFAGAFPLWLAPVQAAVLPVSEKFNEYAANVADALRQGGLRVELDDSSEKVGAKVRKWTLEKVPYMAVVGAREAEAGTVAVRHRTEGDRGAMGLDAFLAALKEEIDTKGGVVLADAASEIT